MILSEIFLSCLRVALLSALMKDKFTIVYVWFMRLFYLFFYVTVDDISVMFDRNCNFVFYFTIPFGFSFFLGIIIQLFPTTFFG